VTLVALDTIIVLACLLTGVMQLSEVDVDTVDVNVCYESFSAEY